ncbi:MULTISPECIES: hypothetical protein [unclassified Mesorhizobium]|uniref:hypothetical protein n=1 Tax=unclassified Mesorhizobium TaxID=325217 RepID=UPI0016745BAA|nr:MULTISPECIES: hypothetical protein [unclassified Mesorhizobium]
MIQFLNILHDVMRIATFQWRGDTRQGGCGERWPGHGRGESASIDRHRIRRARP